MFKFTKQELFKIVLDAGKPKGIGVSNVTLNKLMNRVKQSRGQPKEGMARPRRGAI